MANNTRCHKERQLTLFYGLLPDFAALAPRVNQIPPRDPIPKTLTTRPLN
jgi:hypothetical protein